MGGFGAAAAVQRVTAWRWGALLTFALFAPVALPAGGADRRSPEVRRRCGQGEPLLAPACSVLFSAPQRDAPMLVAVPSGVPLRFLRSWLSPNGRRWVHVEARSQDLVSSQRGWLPVA